MVYEFKELVQVDTPRGAGWIWYLIDYGQFSDTLYTVIIKETGECWQMKHTEFRISQNRTMDINKHPDNGNSNRPGKDRHRNKTR